MSASLSVPGDVAEDDRHLAARRHEHVVEVAAGGRAVGRPVRDRHGQAAHARWDLGHERRLHRAHVAQQRRALALQPQRAQARAARAHREADRQREQREDDRLAPVGHRQRQRDMPADGVERVARRLGRRARRARDARPRTAQRARVHAGAGAAVARTARRVAHMRLTRPRALAGGGRRVPLGRLGRGGGARRSGGGGHGCGGGARRGTGRRGGSTR